jgi:hypothetical protein
MEIDVLASHIEQIRDLRLSQPDCVAVDLDIEVELTVGSYIDGTAFPQSEVSAAAGAAAHRGHI